MEHHHRQPTADAELLSEGKRATAENAADGTEAGFAVDGRDDTHWAGAPYYVWWQLDLERVCRVERLRIETEAGTEGVATYFIEHSRDLLNWDTVVEKTERRKSDAGGEQYETDFEARYIRVTLTYCSTGETVGIRHFQAFGRAPAEREPAAASRRSPLKFAAISYDRAQGFETAETDEIETGRTDRVVLSGEAGSYLLYRGVDFTEGGVDQLRGEFGFADLDKSKRVTLEVRADDLRGEKIGELVLFKQWKRWSVLAGSLKHDNPALLKGVHDVYLTLASVDPGQALMIRWLAFVRRTPLPAPRPKPAALPAPENGEYRIYFGNLHSHTGFSDGIGVPEQAYDYARYEAGLDFLAITEHSNLYDHNLDWNRSRKWADIQRTAEEKTEDGAFLALFGAETTWYNQFGHMNTYNMEFFLNAYETELNEIPAYYDIVKRYPDSIQQWNHPWSCGNRHLDGFEPYDPELDEVLHLIEINTIESKELGGLYYYVLALDKGWHVAPVGSQDNHRGQWGTENTLRTGVLVEKLTREHFFDAVRHRRVYFTSALHLHVWFKVNGAIMGSIIPRTGELEFEIKALFGPESGSRIVKAEIVGERGEVLHAIEHDGRHLEYKVSLTCESRYFFAKIYQEDGEFAATAPVWVNNE